MPRVEYSNTKTGENWNYTRMTQRHSPVERVGLALRMLRHGVLELEFFWKGDQVFIDAVSLRFGESRVDRFSEDSTP